MFSLTNSSNPLFAITIYALAFLTSYLILLVVKFKFVKGRFESIDGLKGLLAVGVFIHHVAAWYGGLTVGKWDGPNSNFYNHLGQTSVAFFFMITSFLFVTKLLNTGEKEFNWKKFFISRFYRLAPLYYISTVLIFLIVFYITNWQLRLGWIDFLNTLFHWSLFAVFKMPQINNAGFSFLINGGVIWSIWYEWLFYFSLPLIGFFILKIKPKPLYLLVGAFFVFMFFIFRQVNMYCLLSFVGGGIAPVLLKYTKVRGEINEIYASTSIFVCLFMLLQFKETGIIYCTVLQTIIFNLIALGCSLFGVLKSNVLKLLGEVCYSTYLLHGILLYILYYFGFGFETLKKLNTIQYYSIAFVMTPLLIVISFYSFKFIEKPFIEKSHRY